jgi:hypothetical protein
MKIFFQANLSALKELGNKYQQIIRILEKNGVSYFSNLQPERAEKSDIYIFNQIEAIIIEGTKLNQEASYILALALSQKKPVLFLVSKGTLLNEKINKLTKDKKLSGYFKLYFYNENNLEKILSRFIDLIGVGDSRKELASIKFTLRLTPKMERYLSWRITNTKMRKADYLRLLLSNIIGKDEDYRKFLKGGE